MSLNIRNAVAGPRAAAGLTRRRRRPAERGQLRLAGLERGRHLGIAGVQPVKETVVSRGGLGSRRGRGRRGAGSAAPWAAMKLRKAWSAVPNWPPPPPKPRPKPPPGRRAAHAWRAAANAELPAPGPPLGRTAGRAVGRAVGLGTPCCRRQGR